MEQRREPAARGVVMAVAGGQWPAMVMMVDKQQLSGPGDSFKARRMQTPADSAEDERS